MAQKKFKPKPGQVDYTNIRFCPVINCIVQYKDKVLLVHRSEDLDLYPNCWNGVSGFLDDDKSIHEKVLEELSEELGMDAENIKQITTGDVLVQENEEYTKTWIVFPVLVQVNTDHIETDWEAKDAKWVKPSEAKDFKLLPGFDEVLARFF
jgi:ADP-ribose pyrophosphatase YjhB (NUDIX family)